MNLLDLSITNSCNREPNYCKFCSFKEWLVPLENRNINKTGVWDINILNNASLLKWFDKYLDPKEWVIQISGGEPAVYSGIQELLPALSDRGYRGLVHTNGDIHLPKTKNIRRIVTWYGGVYDYPLINNYDLIHILKDYTDDHLKKEEYCKTCNIPYIITYYDHVWNKEKQIEGTEANLDIKKPGYFINWMFINSSGSISRCLKSSAEDHENIFNDCPPIINRRLLYHCGGCINTSLIESYLPQDLQELIKKEYEEYEKTEKDYEPQFYCARKVTF